MEKRAKQLIDRASVASAAVGVVLSPLPFADEIVLGGIHLELARRVGKLHGLGILRVPWRPIGLTVAKGLVARGFVNFGLSFIPVVDAVINATTGAGLTEVVGRHIEESCAHPETARVLAFRDLVDALGALQRALSRTEQRTTPLEHQLEQLGRKLAFLSLGSSVAVTAFGMLRGQSARALVRNAIALGVAAFPEGIPTVGTTALALASQRLQKRGIIIRRLAAAETLGAVSVICADKTGTLTENRMRIVEVFLPTSELAFLDWHNGHFSMRTAHDGAPPEEAVHNLARIAALNADVEISASSEITSASGTERALVEFALASGYPVRVRRKTAKRVGETRRSRESPMMLTIHEHPDLGRIELAKGAPEEIVPRCESLTPDQVEAIMTSNAAMAERGLRVLGFAWRRDVDRPLEFAGLVGLRDPPRPHVRQAIESLAAAHIRTLMLTGDEHRTALAIGEALGIAANDVHSRVTPEAKLDIVQHLQRQGAIVAMTGDGVNDGPALKAADVGIAMGERGTDLARAVADVVLARDDLPSLVAAVAEGRTLYGNVRRAIDYLVATNMSEVALMLLGSVGGAVPLAPLHLLWINIVTDVAPALALAMEPPDADVMRRPPRDPQSELFGRSDSRRLGARSAQMTAGALAAYLLGGARAGRQQEYASTMAFASLMTSQILLPCTMEPRAGRPILSSAGRSQRRARWVSASGSAVRLRHSRCPSARRWSAAFNSAW